MKERWRNSLTGQRHVERHRPSVIQAAVSFYDLLVEVPGIEAILGDEDPDGITLSVIVNDLPEELRHRVHDYEWDLMRRYAKGHFDFRVMDRRNRRLVDLVSLEGTSIYLKVPA